MDKITKIRIVISILFCTIVLYQIKDMPFFQDYTNLILLFVIVPLIIYLFVKKIFKKDEFE